MQQDINSLIQTLSAFRQQGKDPQVIMQMLMQRNPNYRQAMQRLQNMSQGKNPQEFIMQLARQQGISQENLQAIQQMLGNKK